MPTRDKDAEIAALMAVIVQLRSHVNWYRTDRDEWKRRAEAAETDTARLDWLEQEGFVSKRVHSWRKDGTTPDQPWIWAASGVSIATVREAIDAYRATPESETCPTAPTAE